MHKIFFRIAFLCAVFALAGCASGGGGYASGPGVGPVSTAKAKSARNNAPKIDVVVPVFDPGLPADSDTWKKKGIYPELRRAEATRFALHMKAALDNSGAFAAARVTPNQRASGELYVQGTIVQSNGEDVRIRIRVRDISGKQWLNKEFSHRVKDEFHRNRRNKGKDAYAPVFEKAAAAIVKILNKRRASELTELQRITMLRFGESLSAESFSRYLKTENGRVKLVSAPAAGDPMLRRIEPLRVRDQLFIDNMQTHYAAFNGKLNESYLAWQEQSLTEVKAARAAKRKATGQSILGGLLLVAGVVGAAEAGDNVVGEVVSAAGAVAGAAVLAQSFQTRAEMKAHREALAELGQSLDLEVAPQVVEYEKQSAKLSGNAAEQHEQWVAFLRKIYELEATPGTQL